MKNFEFPPTLSSIDKDDPTAGKQSQQLVKYIALMQGSLMYEAEKFAQDDNNWFALTYYSLKNHTKNKELSKSLADMLKNQIDKATTGQLSIASEKIILFLVMCYLVWHQNDDSSDHVKVLKGLVKYLKMSTFIGQCYQLIVSTAIANVNYPLGHSIVAILLQKQQDEQLDINVLIDAFSVPSMNCVNLLRRLSRQRTEEVDTDTEAKFRELLTQSNSYFIECAIQKYLLQVNTLYSQQNRDVVVKYTKYLGEYFRNSSLLHTLLGYYDKANYYIRNTATLALSELLKKSYLEEDIGNSIIQLLINRIYDSHVHARSCVMYVIRDLLKSKAIEYNNEFLTKAVEKLTDRSVFARKAACQLLNEVIFWHYRKYGLNAFRTKQLANQNKEIELQKEKLITQCALIQDQLQNNQVDLRDNLDELANNLEKCSEQEKKIKAQLIFNQSINESISSICSITLSKSQLEATAGLKVLQNLLRFHFEGIIYTIKKILILVFNKESIQDIVNLVYNEFALKHYKLIQLIEACDQMELTCLNEIFNIIRQQKLEIKIDMVKQVWIDLKNKKYTLSNLRIAKFINIFEDRDLGEMNLELQLSNKLQFFLDSINKNNKFEEQIEILEIIKYIENEDVHKIYIKSVMNNLVAYFDDSWFKCCELLIRFIAEKIQKPELLLEQLIRSIPKDQIAKQLFVSSTCCLKLFVYSDRLVKEYAKDKSQQMQEEQDLIDGSIQEHLELKAKNLFSLFDFIGEESLQCKSAESICQSIISEQYRERDQIIDKISVHALLQFMIISPKCTERNISTIFDILECNQVSSLIKCNILTLLSDLYYRYPSYINVNRLLNRMNDKNLKVRLTALIIISHLMLMELLKIDVSHIAKHINDEEPRIRVHAKIFFIELYKKDPQKLYQVLPDLITQMAHNQFVTDEDFKVFAAEIIPIIEKDKIAEQIMSKFLQRFEVFTREASINANSIQKMVTEGTEEIINFNPVKLTPNKESKFLSYCLCHLKYHLANIKLLVSNVNVYKDHIKDPQIFEQFKNIYNKCRKVAISQKIQAKKQQTENDSLQSEYNQYLSQLKHILQKVDPSFERNAQQQLKTLNKKQNELETRKRTKKQKFQGIQNSQADDDSDDNSSMDIE